MLRMFQIHFQQEERTQAYQSFSCSGAQQSRFYRKIVRNRARIG